MLNRLGLDETAASRSKRQQLDHLLRATAPHELVVLTGIGLLLLLLLAWSVFAKMEDGVTTDCVLLKPGARYDVVSAEPGQLLEYFVTPGEHVEAGTPIARQSLPGLTRELAALHDQVRLLELDTKRTHGNDELLNSARVAVLGHQALRRVRETIVSQNSGEVMVLQSAPGDYLLAQTPIAQIRNAAETQVRAVLAATPRLAQHTRPGMRASVEVPGHGDDARVLAGEVTAVTDGPQADWLTEFLSAGEDPYRRVDIALEVPSDLADGTACRARVILGLRPPVALLGPGRF